MKNLRAQLNHCLRGRVCLVGIGNIEMGDDGWGIQMAQRVNRALLPSRMVVDRRLANAPCAIILAGTQPERWLSRICEAQFDSVVFLDAVEFGAVPGSVVLLNARELESKFPQISTHKISLALLGGMIEAGSQAKVWLLGVQPGDLNPAAGTGMTASVGLSLEVQPALQILSEWLVDGLGKTATVEEATC